MERNKIFSPVNHVLLMRIFLSIAFFSLISLTIDYNILKDSYGQMLGGHGHNLPPSIVGDREIMLNFNDPEIDSAAEKGVN